MVMPDASAAVFAVGQGVASFTAMLPRITDARKASMENDSFVADLHIAEMAGTVITLSVAAIASSFAKSMAPIWAALFVCLTVIGVYEYALRQDPMRPKLSLIREAD